MVLRRTAALGVIVLIGAAGACGGSDSQKAALAELRADLAATAGAAPAAAPSGGEASSSPDTVDESAEASAADVAAAPETPAAAAPGAPTASAAPKASAPRAPSASAGRPATAASATPAAGGGAAPSGGAAPTGGASSGPAPATSSGEAPSAPAPAKPGGAPGATDVGVSPNSIKVGHIGIYSGPVGSFGDDLSYAGRAALQAVNDEGGVAGRKLDVLVRDDAWDGTKGMNAARDLIERQKIFAMCCIMSVNTSDPLTPYADEKQVPHVGADGWGEPQYEGEWTFPVSASAVVEAHMVADYQGKVQKAKKVAILYINNPTGRAYVQAYKEVIQKHGGDVVIAQPATFDDPGTTTFIAQARTENVDAISTYLDPGIFARMVREAAGQGYKPKHSFSGAAGLYFEVTPDFTGPHAEGTIVATHWVTNDMDTPGFRAYKDVVERYYPDIDHSTWTKAGFVGANMFTSALKRLGVNLTRQALKDDLDKLTDFDTGLGPKLTFRPGQHRSNKTIYLAQMQKSGDKMEWKYLAGPLDDQYSK
jgi:ABC-type branched-subunit amino acid transport system substrate-binding protein